MNTTFISPPTLEQYKRVKECLQNLSKEYKFEIFQIVNVVQEYYPDFRNWWLEADNLFFTPISFPVIPNASESGVMSLISSLSVYVTGARPGEVLFGFDGVAKDALIKIEEGVVPPDKVVLDYIRSFPKLYIRFLGRLSSINFFRNLSLTEREDYLLKNEQEKDVDFAEAGVNITILQMGKSTFLTLEPDDIDFLVTNENINAKVVRDLFPKKLGSGATRQTLIFLRGYWKIVNAYEEVNEFNGLVFDVENSDLRKGYRIGINSNEKMYLFSGFSANYDLVKSKKVKSSACNTKDCDVYATDKKQKIAFIIRNPGVPLKRESLYPLLLEEYPQYNLSDLDYCESCTKNFTAAGYKSLLQKIIRFQPEIVELESPEGEIRDFDPKFYASFIFIYLAIHPGSFVPDIQRFVSGLESALKRLFVTVVEDSYFYDESVIISLMSGAYLAQRLKGWSPTYDMFRRFIKVAADSVPGKIFYPFDIELGLTTKPFTLSEKSTPFQIGSALLDELKSFACDLGMVRSVAVNNKIRAGAEIPIEKYIRPQRMKLEHCIDQHWTPEIAYFFDLEFTREITQDSPKAQPFAILFRDIFRYVTGVNPRKRTYDSSGGKYKYFIDKVKEAQEIVLKSKRHTPLNRRSLNNAFSVETILDDGLISGMIGSVNVPGGVIVTSKPDNPTEFVAIKRPSRGMKDPNVPPDVEDKAIIAAKRILQSGVRTDAIIQPPIPEMKGMKIILEGDEFYISGNGKRVNWNEYKNVKVEIPYFADRLSNELNLSSYLNYTGGGISAKYQERTLALLNNFSLPELRRAYSYLTNYTSTIKFPRVSKDGGGTAEMIIPEDAAAYQLILGLSTIFPAALDRKVGGYDTFNVAYQVLLWYVKDIILERISEESNKLDRKSKEGNFPRVYDSRKRELWEHQRVSVEEMIESDSRGKKGNFLWLNVGLGKTLVCMYFLKYLLEEKGLNPEYRSDSLRESHFAFQSSLEFIIYTLPSSAMGSILAEVQAFGFPVNIVVPLKGKIKERVNISSKNFKKYHLNLIEHDHLRRIQDELFEIAPKSIFIIDEVHKALNESQRTMVCLTTAKLSMRFIAMTGTPVIDSNIYKLIWWLAQITPFEVNEKNFLVAVNSMIAKKTNTGVIVNRIDDEIQIPRYYLNEYLPLVPEAMGGINNNATAKDFMKAINLCYEICDFLIVESTNYYVNERNEGVMVVARSSEHQNKLFGMISKYINPNDIFLITKDKSIYLTDESVESGKVHDYKVVITTIRKSEGYTLTRLGAMITSVYPSNNAVRTQIEGRINRIDQQRDEIDIKIVHCGILTYIYQKHQDAKNLESVLATLADDVNM